MTREQLKTLSTLPAVIEALEAFCAEAEQLRALLARAGMSAAAPQPQAARDRPPAADPRFAPVAPGHAALATPEREEFNADRNAPFVEESAGGETSQQARQRAMMDRIKGDPRRNEALAQFKHDTEDEAVAQ